MTASRCRSFFLVCVALAMMPALLVAPAHAKDDPVIVANGGLTVQSASAPKRAIAMNQAAVEIMLALGLEEQMVGTAFLDDKILPELADAYQRILVLAKKYPSKEIILAANPDFVYASFFSAFSAKRGLPTRRELADMGIASYLSPSASPQEMKRYDRWQMDLLYKEIREIGKIFRVDATAAALIANIKSAISRAAAISAKKTSKQKLKILWLDSFNANGVYIGGGTGVPDEIIRLAGGENTFSDINDSWEIVSQEQVISRPVDLIVLIEATWDTANEKRKKLRMTLFMQILTR
ncbi:MAG: ABC transporter substrate-binding protein [Gammaproteobacteria bacterium]|nr:MAG: ABC transporter substrate-binding protein [Gammaproteobacteria bacterium]